MNRNILCPHRNDNLSPGCGFAVVAGYLLVLVGWFMNFQNLWQYWPATGGIGEAPAEWFISAIGVFAFPVGAFMGLFY